MKINRMTIQGRENKEVISRLSGILSDSDKLSLMLEFASSIRDDRIRMVVMESFSMAVGVIESDEGRVSGNDDGDSIDIADKIGMISSILGYSLEDIVGSLMQMGDTGVDISSKEPDKEALDFIISDVDVDDYEKFLEDNKVKENLDFLNSQI